MIDILPNFLAQFLATILAGLVGFLGASLFSSWKYKRELNRNTLNDFKKLDYDIQIDVLKLKYLIAMQSNMKGRKDVKQPPGSIAWIEPRFLPEEYTNINFESAAALRTIALKIDEMKYLSELTDSKTKNLLVLHTKLLREKHAKILELFTKVESSWGKQTEIDESIFDFENDKELNDSVTDIFRSLSIGK